MQPGRWEGLGCHTRGGSQRTPGPHRPCSVPDPGVQWAHHRFLSTFLAAAPHGSSSWGQHREATCWKAPHPAGHLPPEPPVPTQSLGERGPAWPPARGPLPPRSHLAHTQPGSASKCLLSKQQLLCSDSSVCAWSPSGQPWGYRRGKPLSRPPASALRVLQLGRSDRQPPWPSSASKPCRATHHPEGPR